MWRSLRYPSFLSGPPFFRWVGFSALPSPWVFALGVLVGWAFLSFRGLWRSPLAFCSFLFLGVLLCLLFLFLAVLFLLLALWLGGLLSLLLAWVGVRLPVPFSSGLSVLPLPWRVVWVGLLLPRCLLWLRLFVLLVLRVCLFPLAFALAGLPLVGSVLLRLLPRVPCLPKPPSLPCGSRWVGLSSWRCGSPSALPRGLSRWLPFWAFLPSTCVLERNLK